MAGATATLVIETGPVTRVPDVRDQPLGEQADGSASATAAIRERVLQKKGVEVPVASFQSYI